MNRDGRPSAAERGMPLEGARRAAFNWLNERVYSGAYKVVPVTECFCGAAKFERLSRFDRFGLPFGTQICVACGLISQTRNLDDSAMQSFYNDIYWDLIAGGEQPSYTTVQASFEPFLEMLLPHVPPGVGTVVEVGCGAGERLAHLGARLGPGVRLVGCDYSEGALAKAKEKGIEGLLGGFEMVRGKMTADVVVLSHIVEHLVDLRGALADIRAITREDSTVYVEVPGVIDLVNKREYGFEYQDYNIIAHIHNFSLATLSMVFGSAGFGLVAGNEYARAVFRRNQPVTAAPPGSAYKAIQQALAEAKVKSDHRHARLAPRVVAAIRAALAELRK